MNHDPVTPISSPEPDFDARLRRALHEVDVPVDLPWRILARVAESRASHASNGSLGDGLPRIDATLVDATLVGATLVGATGGGSVGAGAPGGSAPGGSAPADSVADSRFPQGVAGNSGAVVQSVAAAQGGAAAQSAAAGKASAVGRRWRVGTRAAARWAGVGCVVASLVLAAYFVWRPRTPSSVEELVEQVGGWQSRLSSTWEASSDSRPSDHPLDARVKAAAPRWQRLTTAYDAHAVVYELRRGVGRALLFVVRCPTDLLDDSRRLQRLPTTGAQAVGAWRRGPWLYLLSVDETNQRLEDYFSPVPTTVARRHPAKSPESRQFVALWSQASTFHRHDSYFPCNRTENDL